ncbi:unnamed protein product [Sphenostylis stenocarpa]|uniref:Amino acid transporter transmembrane domain-containing protein n=1 Tax=Sphenostylis stenocarpa TaxID=92480 RepID=A0AA86V548_9FABA|nr:unnamed protein product [Sphenostylis stenocarpa]
MQGGKMKLDEDLRPDREDDFQTDDEENQAHRVFENLDDDSDSDNSPLSPSLSNEISTISWPQSYRQSMDMLTSATPPGLNLLKRIGSVGRSNSSIKRSKEDSSLTLPFVSETNLIKQDEHHASTPCLQPLVSSSARFSVNELPPPQQQCSFTKSLTLCSVGGIFATIVVALCLFWVGTVDKVAGFKPGEKVLDLAHLPVSIGLYSFCFAGHAVFPNIYSSMKEPSKFPSVLYVCFAFCLVMYVSVGIMGYITFGDLVSSQFTLNMPKELCASEIATWTTVVTPLTKYALTLLPIALSIEELATSPRLRCHAVSVFVRTTLVILSLFVALSIPYFVGTLVFCFERIEG